MKNLHFSCSILMAIVFSSFMLPSMKNNAVQLNRTTASVDYYLKLEGIKGESTDSKHKEWIEVLSAKIDKRAKTATIYRKSTPISSPQLKRLSISGKQLKFAILDQPDTGQMYKLKDVIISSYQSSGSGSVEMETVVITYTGLE